MNHKLHSTFILLALALAAVLAGSLGPVSASNPAGAYYSDSTADIFWFIQSSDLHIGATGTQDSTNLTWLVTTAKSVIAPSFIIVTGDLTDSTNGNWLGYPNGPYQAEWDQYKRILDTRVGPNEYYDLPGNHEQYNDGDFSYYLANSVQGRATGQTQVSFVKNFSFGNYHFLGINTADNSGSPFSLAAPYGDYAGLDAQELSFISSELAAQSDSALTMVFGHHPLVATGNSDDTYVYYGRETFLGYMDSYLCASYGYGHTHAFSEAFFSRSKYPGFFYLNVASLGKSSSNQYTVFAIDCNGISSTTRTVGSWPVALITAPVDRYYGNVTSPYRYDVTASSSSPIRALAFDPVGMSKVEYRVDSSSTWYPMTNVSRNAKLWSAAWNSTALTQGDHTIEVRATNTTGGTGSNTITTYVGSSLPPPQPQAGVSSLETGKYLTKQATSFSSATTFYQGDTVVFRALVMKGTMPLSGAAVTLSITGPETLNLTTSTSNSQGIAEGRWTTKAPAKRNPGTSPGTDYRATVTGLTASGYAWDGVKAQSSQFAVVAR
jgi:hypothetical protein